MADPAVDGCQGLVMDFTRRHNCSWPAEHSSIAALTRWVQYNGCIPVFLNVCRIGGCASGMTDMLQCFADKMLRLLLVRHLSRMSCRRLQHQQHISITPARGTRMSILHILTVQIYSGLISTPHTAHPFSSCCVVAGTSTPYD